MRVVRLNSTLFPVSALEEDLYARYGLDPHRCEANTSAELIPQLAGCDALFVISTWLPREVVQSLTNCRLISRQGTGTDRIDVQEATRMGIIVSNVPEFGVVDMADHTMAMLLSLNRKLPHMDRMMRAGQFTPARRQTVTIVRPELSVLGLIGFGASARAVAKRALPFGMRVLATRRNMDDRCDADALGVELVELAELLRQSDYVSLHLPLTDESHHLLDEATINAMKPGAYLINTSRGALVDEHALAAALRSGHLAGAGIDTFSGIEIFTEEERPPEHPLVDLDNVILSPHVGGLSEKATETVSITAIENMVSVLGGHLPLPANIVNPDVEPRFPLLPHDPGILARG